jgi:hypothetical protein
VIASHLVFDTTALSYFARADRLDVLGDLLAGMETSVPHVVREEIRDGVTDHPALARILDVEWLRAVPLDTLDRPRECACRAPGLTFPGSRECIVFSEHRRNRKTLVSGCRPGRCAGRTERR